jgi:hypothetical protein
MWAKNGQNPPSSNRGVELPEGHPQTLVKKGWQGSRGFYVFRPKTPRRIGPQESAVRTARPITVG